MNRRDFLNSALAAAALAPVVRLWGRSSADGNKLNKTGAGKMKLLELPEYGIIDAHMHPYLAEHRDFPFPVPATYNDFFAEQRRAGIVLSCGAFNIRTDGSDFSVIEECNRRVLKLHEERPEEYLPGVNIHPNFPEESCREVRKFYDLGFRWVGELAWYFMGYKKYAQPGMFQILELVQSLGMTLNIHPSTIEDEAELAANFPRLPIVIAHPESNGIMKNYELAQKYPNIFFDLSGHGLSRWGMLRKGIDLLGPERFLFGTDFPVVSSGMYVAGVLFEHLTESERKCLFRENFLRLTGYGNARRSSGKR